MLALTNIAARTNKPQNEEKTKGLIRASQLINRLTSHANGEIDLSSSQVNAARIVIGKYIPDLKAIEHTGEGGGPLQIQQITRKIVK